MNNCYSSLCGNPQDWEIDDVELGKSQLYTGVKQCQTLKWIQDFNTNSILSQVSLGKKKAHWNNKLDYE